MSPHVFATYVPIIEETNKSNKSCGRTSCKLTTLLKWGFTRTHNIHERTHNTVTVKYPSRDFVGHHKKQSITMPEVRKAPPGSVRISTRKTTTKTPSKDTDGVDLPGQKMRPSKETTTPKEERSWTRSPSKANLDRGYVSPKEDLAYASP